MALAMDKLADSQQLPDAAAKSANGFVALSADSFIEPLFLQVRPIPYVGFGTTP